MTAHQKEVVIGLEGEIFRGGEASPWKLKLSTTIIPEEGGSITESDVLKAAEHLRTILATALKNAGAQEMGVGGALPPVGPPRSLDVLREVYTPRSPEHVDALLWEGQITATEHSLLVSDIRGKDATAHTGARHARSPEEIAKELRLENMRDANLARAKEVVTYEEWIALKRFFSEKRVEEPSGEHSKA
jgi:hypothetical protein